MNRFAASGIPCADYVFLALASIFVVHPNWSPQANEGNHTSPTLKLLYRLPRGSSLRFSEKAVVRHFKFRGQARSRPEVLYYLDLEDTRTKQAARLWEGVYSRSLPQGYPSNPVVVQREDAPSSIGFALTEAFTVRFYEIDLQRPIAILHEERIRNGENEEFLLGRPASDPSRTIFFPSSYIAEEEWVLLGERPPRVTKLWRDQRTWRMTVAAAAREFHFVLRDGTKEWVWINRP